MKQGLTSAVEKDWPFFGLTGVAPGFMFLYRLFGGGAKGTRVVANSAGMLMGDVMGLSNIGRIEMNEEHYGSFRISALGFVGSMSVMGSSLFTAASLGGTLCFNFIAMNPVISSSLQHRVAERARVILEAAVTEPPSAAIAVAV
jgi:hypothetical protein